MGGFHEHWELPVERGDSYDQANLYPEKYVLFWCLAGSKRCRFRVPLSKSIHFGFWPKSLTRYLQRCDKILDADWLADQRDSRG